LSTFGESGTGVLQYVAGFYAGSRSWLESPKVDKNHYWFLSTFGESGKGGCRMWLCDAEPLWLVFTREAVLGLNHQSGQEPE